MVLPYNYYTYVWMYVLVSRALSVLMVIISPRYLTGDGTVKGRMPKDDLIIDDLHSLPRLNMVQFPFIYYDVVFGI